MGGPVFDAWTSGDLDSMLAVLDFPAKPVDRHFLLQSIVDETYKLRTDRKMRALCEQVGRQHLAEFPSLKGPLKRSVGGHMPRVSTFQLLATVLTENGEFDEAVRICELAIDFDLHDNTRGGFEGRIERIRRKQKKGPVMSLIKCPDCGKEVSDLAVSCIHCGRPNRPAPPAGVAQNAALKRKLNQTSWLLFIASVLLGVGGAGAGMPALYGVAGICFVAALSLAIAYYVV